MEFEEVSSIPLGSLVRIELFSIWAVGAEKIRDTTYLFFRIKGLCFCDVLSLGISNHIVIQFYLFSLIQSCSLRSTEIKGIPWWFSG